MHRDADDRQRSPGDSERRGFNVQGKREYRWIRPGGG